MIDDGRTGLLADAGDDDALGGAVLRLESDAALRARLSQAAYDRARQEFSMEKMVARYEALYEELLSKA